MTDGPQAHGRVGSPGVGSPGGPRHDDTREARASPAPPDLEQRIAALAAQVRTLAQRFTVTPPESSAAQAAHAPSPVHGPDVASEASSPSPARAPGIMNAIVVAAEAAAGEIRASAEREAQLIRAAADPVGAIGGIHALRDTIARQRETLAGLAAETTRVERSAAILRAQVCALEAEMQQALIVVDALAERES
jgi:uncharacterized coiled-coil protein SlyX